MKLIVFLSFCLSFSTFAHVSAQKVGIDVRNEPFRSVVRELQKQSGYSFAIHEKYIKLSRPVTLAIKDVEILDALPLLFAGQPFGYEVDGRTVSAVVVEKGREVVRQQLSIRGKVTDSIGNPLEGVTVIVGGTGIQTHTDKQGLYELTNVPSGNNLMFRLLSYETLEIAADKPIINIILKLVRSFLDEPIVIAYGTTTRRFNTGSISSIKAKEIQMQPVSDPLLTLAGRIPGLYIAQNSGVPGSRVSSIRLRGQNSIANGSDPLFIIDGIPFSPTTLTNPSFGGGAAFLSPFNSINPLDIESMEILKDGDATAIYGSRGANGVVIITTKKGREGKSIIDINMNSGVTEVSSKVELMNTQQYLEMRREAFENDGVNPSLTDYDVNGVWDISRYTDWQEILIGNTGRINEISGSLSGGVMNTSYLVSSTYRKETTVFPGDFSDQKISFAAKINHSSDNRKFNIQIATSYLKNTSLMPKVDFTQQILLPPNAPALYQENGGLNWENSTWDNPLATLNNEANAITENLAGSGLISYKFLKDLEIKSSFGYNKVGMEQSIITRLSSYDPVLYNGLTFFRSNAFPSNKRDSWIVEPQISYTKLAGPINLNVLIGTTFQQDTRHLISISVSDFVNDALIETPTAGSVRSILAYENNIYKYSALFGRVNMEVQGKYILNVTGRRDGSSRFGQNNRFGNFGSIGAAWIFSEESLLKDHFGIMNFGKLRASYGVTGNDQFADYQYLSTYTSYTFPYQGMIGLYPTRIANPYYGWETVKKFESGIDLGFFDDRINFEVSYYNNRTQNQLVGYSLPSLAGFDRITANLPAVIENQGWEFNIRSSAIQRQNFQWNTTINFSVPKNKLVSYPDLETSTYANRYLVGKSLFIQRKFTFNGVDPISGVYSIQDVNGDGVLTTPQDLNSYIERTQQYFGGFVNSFTYKGFSIDFLFQFVKQSGTNPFGIYGGLPGTMVNRPTVFLDRWQIEGDDKRYQKFSQNSSTPAGRGSAIMQAQSDAIVSDASFLRIKNLSISYSINKSATKLLKLNSCRIYAQGQNLFTITKFEGADPETQNAFLPPLRVFILGFQISI